MYINPFGLSNSTGNPYAALEQQIRQQLAEIEELGRKAMASLQGQQPDPQQQQQIPQPVQAIAAAIEKNMKQVDLQFLSQNISRIPEFLGSKDGQDILQMAVDGLRKLTGENTTATTEPGKTTG